jgi:hypothetical protein
MANGRAHGEAHRFGRSSKLARSLSLFHRFVRDSEETSERFGSFAITMKVERELVSPSDMNSMDRQVIRVDIPPTQAGVTAALRRAFEAAATEPCDRDFAELLRRLN